MFPGGTCSHAWEQPRSAKIDDRRVRPLGPKDGKEKYKAPLPVPTADPNEVTPLAESEWLHKFYSARNDVCFFFFEEFLFDEWYTK